MEILKIKDLVLSSNDKEEFERNGIKLLDDDKQSISKSEFDNEVQREVNKFCYPFENIVVLAGAGASVKTNEERNINNEYGKTVQMIANSIKQILEEETELYDLEELSNMCSYDKYKLNEDGKLNQEFNLEDFLSDLFTYGKYIKKEKEKFINTKNEILKIIRKETSYNFDECLNHSKFIKILSDKLSSPNRLHIATTNYDTLFEEAAENINFTVIDGFTFSTKPKFDVTMFDWDIVRAINNISTHKVEYKKNVLDILKMHGSLSWCKSKDNKEILRIDKNSNDNPLIIFPSSNKYMESYEEPYFDLFTKFQELIKRQNTLLITTGFSFADIHISKMIIQAIENSPSLTLLVTDYDIQSVNKNKNWLDLENLLNNGFRIGFLKATMDGELCKYLGGFLND